jgi:hypothetical protein
MNLLFQIVVKILLTCGSVGLWAVGALCITTAFPNDDRRRDFPGLDFRVGIPLIILQSVILGAAVIWMWFLVIPIPVAICVGLACMAIFNQTKGDWE